MDRRLRIFLVFLCVISSPQVGALCWQRLQAEEISLHEQIDALIVAVDGPQAERSSDAEFLRRVYLDLIGRIPSLDEARAFLNDTAVDKRIVVIDHLLDSDEYPHRMRDLFHVMLMERLGDDAAWASYLEASFRQNKPWSKMASEIAKPDADDESTRGAAFFLAKRLENYGQNPVDYPGLVRDIGRLFLGVDVQCAQCHDHLFVDDYKQVDYQGLFGFVGSAFLRQDVTFPAVGEKPLTKKIDFKSVFVMEDLATGPRLPGGSEIEIPSFPAGEEYITPPDKKTRFPGTPKFSPLQRLSEQLIEHPGFRRNIANRLWWMMMGRGLVMPLDLQHRDNPPSHPELLELLGHELAARDYDLRWFLRELALSEVYQRSSLLPDDSAALPGTSYRVAWEKPLATEQLLASLWQATATVPLSGSVSDEKQNEGVQDLPKLRERFAKAFANPPREPEIEHSPSVKAALFLLNDDVVLSWLKPQSGNLVAQLLPLESPDQLAETLYLSVLTRLPDAEERTEVAEYLSVHADQRETAIGQLVWALFAATEFSVNH